jgi:hypothetical protein
MMAPPESLKQEDLDYRIDTADFQLHQNMSRVTRLIFKDRIIYRFIDLRRH